MFNFFGKKKKKLAEVKVQEDTVKESSSNSTDNSSLVESLFMSTMGIDQSTKTTTTAKAEPKPETTSTNTNTNNVVDNSSVAGGEEELLPKWAYLVDDDSKSVLVMSKYILQMAEICKDKKPQWLQFISGFVFLTAQEHGFVTSGYNQKYVELVGNACENAKDYTAIIFTFKDGNVEASGVRDDE